jgi:hypothetical protein
MSDRHARPRAVQVAVLVAVVVGAGAFLVWLQARGRAPAAVDLRTRHELEQLRAEVARLSASQAAGRAAGFATQPLPLTNPNFDTGTSDGQLAAPSASPASARDAQERDFARQQAAERIGAKLEDQLLAEPVDPVWRAGALHSIDTAFGAIKTSRVVEAECKSRLCRVVVVSDSAEEQRLLGEKLLTQAPFDQQVYFKYDLEAKPPKTTLYVGREGTELGLLVKGTD